MKPILAKVSGRVKPFPIPLGSISDYTPKSSKKSNISRTKALRGGKPQDEGFKTKVKV